MYLVLIQTVYITIDVGNVFICPTAICMFNVTRLFISSCLNNVKLKKMRCTILSYNVASEI